MTTSRGCLADKQRLMSRFCPIHCPVGWGLRDGERALELTWTRLLSFRLRFSSLHDHSTTLPSI